MRRKRIEYKEKIHPPTSICDIVTIQKIFNLTPETTTLTPVWLNTFGLAYHQTSKSLKAYQLEANKPTLPSIRSELIQPRLV